MAKTFMGYQAVLSKHRRLSDLLLGRQLLEGMEGLRDMVRESGKEYINQRLDELHHAYEQLLRHSFSGARDPERDKVYAYLQRSLLELADELKEDILTAKQAQNTYRIRHEMLSQGKVERQEALSILEHLTFDRELAGILRDVQISDSSELPTREEALVNAFNIIWLTDKYSEAELGLMTAVCDSEKLPWHDKALIVSALTISLLRFFDLNKFLLLFRFVEKQQPLVWERAMIGLFLAFLKHNRRVSLYPVLLEKTAAMQSFPAIDQHIEAIVIQYTKSKETEKVRRKWEEEILPEMLKMRPRIEEKLDLENIIQDDPSAEKNPDWETVFEDAPDLLNKLQEFTEMQMEGMDVFMSAFSRLKHFPFFREISNWFVPFYRENQVLQPVVAPGGDRPDLSLLTEKLEDTHYMCNSDKYSFCLNLSMVPDQQKTMMMNMLSEEMKQISQLEKDERLVDGLAATRSLYTQYFQDLYRFYKLHPWRAEFDDVFDMDLDLYQTGFVRQLVSDPKTVRNIAELFFDKGFYADALKVFLHILDRDKSNIELFEKIAFCHERNGAFDQALTYYQKADLIESDRSWIILKLAFCSKQLQRWEEALRYYQQAEKLDPDNLKIQASIGQCLIHLGRFEEALSCYFRVEVLAPENSRIRRPLAWCSFMAGKLDTARDYLNRLLAEDPANPNDLLNLGHVLWSMGKTAEAFSTYKQSRQAWKDAQAFQAALREDGPQLLRHGITEFDLDLMLDYLQMSS